MRFALMSTVALIGSLATQLRAQDSTTAAAPAASAQPAASATAAPAAPSSSLGLYVFPAKDQSPDQQKKDESECYAWANEQSGIDPTKVTANTDSAKKAGGAKADSATAGAGVKGAAAGAVGGAVVGGIAG